MTDARGRVPGQRGAGVPQGRPGRGGGRPQGVRRLVRRDGVQPGPGAVPGGRDAGGPARAVHRGGRRRPRAPGAPGRSPLWTRPSTAGSGTRAGPTSSRPCSAAANPVAGPYFSFTVPEPTGVVAVLAPQASSLLGLVSVLAPVIGRAATPCVVVASAGPAAARDHPVRGAGDLGRARRRGQHADRPDRRAGAVAGRARRRQRAGPDRRAGRSGSSWSGRRPAR